VRILQELFADQNLIVRPKLGIIAGGGELVSELCSACSESGRQYFVVGIRGNADQSSLQGTPHKIIRLGAIGELVSELRKQAVEEIVMVGSIQRPTWQEVRPDLRALRLLPRFLSGGQGDGDILRIAIMELENEGFRVIGVEQIMPDLLTPVGSIGRYSPSSQVRKDIALGLRVATTIGHLDIGQAVVVQQGLVLGVEAAEGTDSLIFRCGLLSKRGEKGTLIKVKKPLQDSRADLPTIGPYTVRRAQESGLGGIVLQARASLIVGRRKVIELADRHGIFVLGIDVKKTEPNNHI
tara:strand:- start:8297 stop:9181 length:885 start_codon:yes stop_codon:yes gene_type:complete